MTDPVVRVACCQVAPRLGDLVANAAIEADAVGRALADDASLVVLPELSRTGYVFETLDEVRAAALPANNESFVHLSQVIDGHRGIVVSGFVETDGDHLYNSIAAVDATGIVAVYRKVHLWQQEPRWFRPGSEKPPVVDVDGALIGLATCYDLFFPELVRDLAERGADIVACPTNSAADTSHSVESPAEHRPDERIGVAVSRAQAHINRVWIVVADRCGTERGVDWNSRTVVVGPEGDVVQRSGGHAPEIVVVNCDTSISRNRRWIGTVNGPADLRSDLYPRSV